MSPCPLCRAAGFDGTRCGFLGSGVFRPRNWRCATLISLRAHISSEPENVVKLVTSADQNFAIISLSSDHEAYENPEQLVGADVALLSWYKNRGETTGAWLSDGEQMWPMSYPAAEAVMLECGIKVPCPSCAGLGYHQLTVEETRTFLLSAPREHRRKPCAPCGGGGWLGT